MLALLLAFTIQAQSSQPAAGSAAIENLAWMTGHWVATNTEDLSEEVWLPPANESMLGMWRWGSKGQMRLYELLAITREGDRLVLRLKHFRPDLHGLEEKDQPFVLYAVDGGASAAARKSVVFEGKASDGGMLRISYRRPDAATLEAAVEKTGSRQVFTYRLKDAAHGTGAR